MFNNIIQLYKDNLLEYKISNEEKDTFEMIVISLWDPIQEKSEFNIFLIDDRDNPKIVSINKSSFPNRVYGLQEIKHFHLLGFSEEVISFLNYM